MFWLTATGEIPSSRAAAAKLPSSAVRVKFRMPLSVCMARYVSWGVRWDYKVFMWNE